MGPARSRSSGSAVRLRALSSAANIAMAAIMLVACAALIILPTLSRRDAKTVIALNAGLRAIDTVRIDLTAFGRESDLAYLTFDPRYEAKRTEIESDLLAHLNEAKALVEEPRQRELLEEAESKIRAYLVKRRQAESGSRTIKAVLLASTPTMEAAIDVLHQVSHMGFHAVFRAERRLERWSWIQNVLGIAVGALVLIGSIAFGAGLRRWVFAPLLALSDGINRFAAGDQTARVDPTGPQEFRRTAESFNEMATGLESKKQELLTFVAGVAHDLRNPLAALRMSVEYLQPGRAHPSEEKVQKTLDLVGRQVTLLERMVGDFLDASRIESGHLELQLRRRDIRALAEQAVELYQPSSFAHRLVVSLPEEPVVVLCDEERIAQVLNNLVSNAIKYSPRGGDVVVSVSEKGEEAIISVSDHGIGIAAADLEGIFQPFRRTGASRESVPGVGLGLSVSRHIIEAHGGHLEVESTLCIGTTFRVRLPLAQRAAARKEESTAPSVH